MLYALSGYVVPVDPFTRQFKTNLMHRRCWFSGIPPEPWLQKFQSRIYSSYIIWYPSGSGTYYNQTVLWICARLYCIETRITEQIATPHQHVNTPAPVCSCE